MNWKAFGIALVIIAITLLLVSGILFLVVKHPIVVGYCVIGTLSLCSVGCVYELVKEAIEKK